jgi:hypothetical protein
VWLFFKVYIQDGIEQLSFKGLWIGAELLSEFIAFG